MIKCLLVDNNNSKCNKHYSVHQFIMFISSNELVTDSEDQNMPEASQNTTQSLTISQSFTETMESSTEPQTCKF